MQSSEFQQRFAGGYTAQLRRWLPDGGTPSAVVQIVHGMAEHSARYARLAEALTGAGFAVYAHDLPGHGPLAGPETRGHFADRRGWRVAIASIRDAQRLAQQEHPRRPLFLLGHSLGSFLLQHYVADFGATLSGAVFSATTGKFGTLNTVGRSLVRGEALIYGLRRPSVVGEAISFKTFNKKFRPARTDFDWLSRDPAEVDKYVADPCCGFRCTTGLWLDVLTAASRLTEPARLRRIPKTLPVLLLAGGDDPVSGGAAGPASLERCYRDNGLRDVTVRIYPRARHELFNDLCRNEVTCDLVAWCENRLNGSSGNGGSR